MSQEYNQLLESVYEQVAKIDMSPKKSSKLTRKHKEEQEHYKKMMLINPTDYTMAGYEMLIDLQKQQLKIQQLRDNNRGFFSSLGNCFKGKPEQDSDIFSRTDMSISENFRWRPKKQDPVPRAYNDS